MKMGKRKTKIVSDKTGSDAKTEYLTSIYTTTGHPASFSGPKKLRFIANKEGKFHFSEKEIQNFLETQDTYTVNKQVRRRFRRNKVLVHGLNDQYEMNLCDVSKLARSNRNIHFLLLVVDVFSRYAFVEPLKNKRAESVLKALEGIFTADKHIKRVRSDRGTEFKNFAVKQFFASRGIKQYFAHNPLKCQIVERLNQTIKQLIYRYLFQNNTYKYFDVLDKIVLSYNLRSHKSLHGLSPSEVTPENQVKLWNRMYIHKNFKNPKTKEQSEPRFKYNVGDLVRISFDKKTFERAFNIKYSLEPFQISARHMRDGIPVYLLKDMKNEPLLGGYVYENELVRIRKDDSDLWKISRTLRRRGKGAKQEALVRWESFPPSFDSWIKMSSIKNVS